MPTRLNNAIKRPALWLSVLILVVAVSAPVFAHGGYDHIMGTVAKVADNVLTVKTDKGSVDVKLDNQTELTMNHQKAQVADLKPGARVIVDVHKGSKDMVAHSVKIGAVSQNGHAVAHGAHK